MKKIFTLLFLVLLSILGNNSYASAFKKTKNPDQRNSLMSLQERLLKSVTLADQPDSATFSMWDQNDWKLSYASSYMYEGSLQVQDMSYYFNDDGMTVNYVFRTTTEYDDMNRVSVETMQNLEGGGFVNSFRSSYSYYNNTNMQTLVLYETWDGGNWVSTGRDKTNYDEMGNETSFISEWGSGEFWFVNYGDSTQYQYDGNKKIMETYFDYQGGAWVPYEKWAFTWTGDVATSAIVWQYEGGEWTVGERYVDVEWNNPGGVDLNGEPSHYKIQHFTESGWMDSLQVSSTYDGNIQTRVTQIWKDGDWANLSMEEFDFTNIDNEDFMFVEYLLSEWVGDPGDWVLTEGTRTVDSYEKSALAGRLISSVMQSYDLNTSDQWVNEFKVEYFYDSTTDVQTLLSENGISVYPNPSDGMLNLKFGKDADRVEIAIYNSVGAKVFSDQIDNLTAGFIYSKDFQQFEKGLYFINIQSGDMLGTLKFVIQ